jgi:predicted acetyltransferase
VIDGLAIDGATAGERPVLENLVQLYIHDFSELFAGTPRCDLENDGRYHPDIPLGDWWRLADHVPLLLRVHGRLAGFVLLNATTHSGAAADRNIAEFFVVRKYRRLGVGRAAAHVLFSRYPGRWEAAVMRANTGARTFWERAIATHPGLLRLDAAERGHFTWDGTIFRFDIAPA